MLLKSLPKSLSAGPKKAEKVDGKKFSDFAPSQGLTTTLYQMLSYKLIGIFFTINSWSCQWTSDTINASVNTNRLAKQCQISALSFESSTPSYKNYGENRIVNRESLVKQCATRALWAESIRIPNANDNENTIVNRGGLAKHCPRNPLSTVNCRADVQQNILTVDMEHS